MSVFGSDTKYSVPKLNTNTTAKPTIATQPCSIFFFLLETINKSGKRRPFQKLLQHTFGTIF